MGTSIVQSSGGGGFEKATAETQTGDAETQLQEIEIPDEDGWHNVIARIAAQANDGSTEYAAIKRIEKKFRKKNDSIQPNDTADHSPASPLDEVGGLFRETDMTLQDAGNGNFEILGKSPTENSKTADQSSIADKPSDTDKASCDIDLNTLNLFYAFDNGSSIQLYDHKNDESNQILSPSTSAAEIDIVIDSSGVIHAAFVDPNDSSKLKYGKSSNDFTVEVVDSNSTDNISIDVDEADVPYIAYGDGNLNNIKLSNRIGGSWSSENIKTSSAVAYNTNLNVNQSDDIGILFGNSDSDVEFAEGSPGNFTRTVLATEFPWCCSVDKIDATSNWLLSYILSDSDDLFAATGNVSSGFNTTKLDDTATDGNESVVSHSDGNLNTVLAQGSSSSADPYDAIRYNDSGGSWSRIGVLDTFGNEWVSNGNGDFVTISDNSGGDEKVGSYNIKSLIGSGVTINWKFGYQVTNP